MSSIYDNIEQPILPELQAYLKQAYRADFCVGYFNLRGWRQIDADIEQFEGGEGKTCRLIVGMHRLPKEELRQTLAIGVEPERIDQGKTLRLQTLMAEEFRQQLTYGVSSSADQEGLRRLRSQSRRRRWRARWGIGGVRQLGPTIGCWRTVSMCGNLRRCWRQDLSGRCWSGPLKISCGIR